MLTDAIAKVAQLVTRLINLFDPDPERTRLKALEKAKDRLLTTQKEIEEIEKKIASSRLNP